MTIRLNPADLTTTRSDLGLAIGTDVLAPNGSAANLTNMPADLSGDLRNIALGSAADRITLLNGIVDPLTDETDVNGGTITFEGGTATTGNTHSSDQAWAAQRFTASQSGKITGVKFAVAGRDFGSGCEVRIETSDGSTAPTGTLVNSNAVLTTSARVQASATTFYEEDFSTSFDVVSGTVYWIVVGRNGSETYGLYNITSGANTGTGTSLAGSFQAAYEMSIKAVIVPGDSINQIFTSGSGGFYNTSTVATLIAGGTGTAVGDMTAGGNLASAFDGTTSQAASASATGANDTGSSFIGKDWGSGNSDKITKYELFAPSDGGFDPDTGGSTITIKLVGSDSTPSIGSGTQLHTDSFSDATGLTKTYTTGITTTTAYRYHWVEVATNTTNSGQKHGRLAEVKFYNDSPQNLTLISNAYTATSAPSKAVLGIQTVESGSVTLNTDLKGFVSRDGGSNFTEVTLALKTTLGQTGTKYYECAETTLTSTSGSSMVWKITTHNTKDIQVHGVALSWS